MNEGTLWRLVLAWFTLSTMALAQAGAVPTDTGPEGKVAGDYRIQQSLELGYRFTEVKGSSQVFDTFINQNEGPRLLQQSLSMHSLHHTGALFDELTASSTGWGGDPQNFARLQMSKTAVYDFSVLFRRDQNFFDYDLLTNPLNPATSNPTIPVTFSPHQMQIRRRMYDLDLTVLPESKFSFRVGFSRNRSEGPSLSSFHEGTDVSLNQNWNVSENALRFGFDAKVLPSTSISYDQNLEFDSNDTGYSLNPFAAFPLANGTLVSFGLPIDTVAGSPCAAPLKSGFVNPSCNGYFSYTRTQRVRTTTPTEALSFQSNYFKRVNLTGRVTYSSGTLNSPYSEFFDGLVTRTRERQFTFSGPVSNRRVAVSADLGLTADLTDTIHLSDDFRFDNFHIPGIWNSSSTLTVGVPVGTPPAVTLLSPLGATTTATDFIINLLGQKSYSNTIQVEFSPSARWGLRVGYRLRHHHMFHAEPEDVPDPESGLGEFEGDNVDVNEHTPLVGVWLRPTSDLRINLEAEATSADNFITRVSPRQKQNYRARTTYKPVPWANLAATINIWENRNGESDTNFKQHYRNLGFAATLLPRDRFALDLAYNYTDALQQAFICYNSTVVVPGAVVNGCPTFSASTNNNPNRIYSTYINNTHYFSASVMLKPVKKLTTNLGYGITSVGGNTTLLNPLAPLGPLQFNYHQPLASLSYEMAKEWSFNAYWNYDQYGEGSFVGPTNPRYFHDNRTVLSVKYAF